MPKLVPISGKKMIKLLGLCGFEIIRKKGSHYFLKNKGSGYATTVPVHKNENLGIGIIKSILSDVDMNKEKYERLRKSP